MVKVSVIMPVYNCEDYLKDSVDSILNQTLSDLELICVDDGSTDNSLEILKEYESQDSRVKLFALNHLGAGDARNFALNHICGEYLYFIDADDILDLNAFEDFYAISKSKNLDFLMFKAKKYDVIQKTLFESDYYSMAPLSNFNDKVFNFKDLDNLIFSINVTAWCKFYNTRFVLDSGAKFRSASKFNDNQFFWDIIFQAERIYFLDEFYYTQNVHPKSLIQSAGKNHCDKVDVLNGIWELFKKHGQFDNFKQQLYEIKLNRYVMRYDEIKDEFKELFFKKIKQDLKNLKESNFRDYLNYKFKFVFDSVMISKNHDDFDMLKEFYYILRNDSQDINQKMNQSIGWFDKLSKSHKRFAFNYIRMFFINHELTSENWEFLNKFQYDISIIIPVFNVKNYLNDAFNSILNQTLGFNNLEIIFIDDASTDGSSQIINEYSDKYDNVISIFLDKNSGYAGLPRNIGMYYATAPYLMFLDPDDVFTHDACETLYNQIAFDNLDVVCGVHSDGESVPDWILLNVLTDCQEPMDVRYKKYASMVKDSNFELKIDSVDEYPSVIAAVNIWDKIFKKSLIKQNKIDFPDSCPAQDSVFLLNVFLNANGIKFINKIILKHDYQRENSIQHQYSKVEIKKRIQAYFMMYWLFIENDKTELFMHYLLVEKLRDFLVDYLMKSNLNVGELLEILEYVKPLFKLYVDYDGVIPGNLFVFEDIANGDFENVLRFIYGDSTLKQKEIMVALIKDSFSNYFIKHEFDLMEINHDDWLNQFECKKPDFFFCESAYEWKITNQNPYGIWTGKLKLVNKGEVSPVIEDILSYCHENNIPTIFWNNAEDIALNDSNIDFISTASKFDYIFTSCIESIENYKNKGYDNVYPLMFAAQPKLFNPIKTDRFDDTVIFTGSWNSNFPKRCKVMNEIFDKIINNGLNLKIYDKCFNSLIESRKYPQEYQAHVNDGVYNLEIPRIYKESEFGLIFNNVTNSDTLFNRNVFELMASNTVVLSNYSKGIYRLFKDNVLYLDKNDFDLNINFNKIKEENLYNILEKHTYSNRFRQMLDAINFKYIPDLRHIVIFYRLDDLNDLTKILNHFYSIYYPYKHLKLITHEDNLFLPNSVLESDLKSIVLNDNYYFIFADLNLNPEFVKKALLHFSYIDSNVGICENDENKYCFGKTKAVNNIVFNSTKYPNLFSNDGEQDIYYI